MRYLLSIFTLVLLALTSVASAEPSMKPVYLVKTSLGEFKIEVNAEMAPATALNFDQYVADGFYNGTLFHRVLPKYMIQGGGFDGSETLKTTGLREPIQNEWRNGLKNVRGAVAMARTTRKPDSATSQFLINVRDNGFLDQPNDGAAYAVFGTVTEGMETVDQINQVPVAKKDKLGAREAAHPVTPVVIELVSALVPLDRPAAEARQAIFADELERLAAEAVEAKKKAAMAEVEDFVAAKEKELGREREVTESGLISIVMKDGSGGAKPTEKNSATVHYTGTFLDGTEFDSSRKPGRTPFDVNMSGGVIQGWLEGLKLMTAGERRLFIIPPALGYGEAGSPPTIPPSSWLVFDVEMLEIK